MIYTAENEFFTLGVKEMGAEVEIVFANQPKAWY